MAAMSHRPRYHLPAETGGPGRFFFWLFVLLVAGIIGFVWWNNRKPAPKPATPKRPIVVAVANAPVASPQPTVNSQSPPPPPTNRVTVMAPVLVKTNRPLSVTVSNAPAKQSSPTVGFPRPPRDTLEAQVALARRAISSGSIDGVNGSQTRAAFLAFQKAEGLALTGELDVATRAALVLDSVPLTSYVITSNDLARLQPVSKTWLGKSQQSVLDYETILELVAEKGHASPTLTKKLNPGVNWTNLVAGDEVKIPAVDYPAPKTKAAFVVISLAERRMQAFDENTNLLAHFPCSIAAKFEKRPVGELHVKAVAPNPDYTFNPEVFPESEEAQQLKTKLILPPGPNNPVGTAWISLDRPGYGMHGTPSPEQVGRTESHGCFRLANWNAEHLIKLVWVGMPVWVEP
jgi:lipoprotein-anchoring transpeptidase ErfK/SrfK